MCISLCSQSGARETRVVSMQTAAPGLRRHTMYTVITLPVLFYTLSHALPQARSSLIVLV